MASGRVDDMKNNIKRIIDIFFIFTILTGPFFIIILLTR